MNDSAVSDASILRTSRSWYCSLLSIEQVCSSFVLLHPFIRSVSLIALYFHNLHAHFSTSLQLLAHDTL